MKIEVQIPPLCKPMSVYVYILVNNQEDIECPEFNSLSAYLWFLASGNNCHPGLLS